MLFRGLKCGDGLTGVFRDTKPFIEFQTDQGNVVPLTEPDWPGPSDGSLRLAFALCLQSLPDYIAVQFGEAFDEQVVRSWNGEQWACTTEGIQAWASSQPQPNPARAALGDVLFHLRVHKRLLLPPRTPKEV